MQLPVIDIRGASVGTLEVSEQLFGVPMNTSVVHQAMVMQLANLRQGTSSTKTRALVSGGGIKPRPQKHTGRARQGSIRAPQWKGGGIVFGPHPRSFRQRMPKKMRRLAIRCLLSGKVSEDRLTVVEALDIPEAKTREMKQLLQALNATARVLLVTPEKDERIVLAARNLDGVKTLPAPGLSTLDLLDCDRLIMTVGAVRKAEELWAGGATEGGVVSAAAQAPRRRRARKSAAEQPAAPQPADEPPASDEEA
ncbi:MAG: 50S ribosomal protein L4 [Chloroflexi bacterium]|nr:50S ribosomal protein L4 [Chloroflexota bacterium]